MIKRIFVLFLSLILLQSSSVVLAADLPFTQDDLNFIYRGQVFRDPGEPTTSSNICGVGNTGGVNKIYMIGDSITEGAEPILQDFLSESGATLTIDGLSSRRLTSGSLPTDGLSVLVDSAQAISGSDVVIIALGTNSGLTEGNINEAINIVNQSANLPKIYWVNTFADNSLRSSTLPFESWNNTLLSLRETRDFTIIDWASVAQRAVEAAGGDGLALLKEDGTGVHPNETGNELFGQTIYNTVFSGAGGGSCAIGLTGEDNPEKVWNFMISKGLEPFQVAGFMGNMQAEAGFEPRRVEYPRTDGSFNDVWIDGRFPDSLSDTVPGCLADSCRPGYGIVQWTASSRKDGLRNFANGNGRAFAANANLPEGDLAVQLEYVWVEISGTTFRGTASVRQAYFDKYGQNRPIIEALRETTTVEEATDLILNHYEIPANISRAYVTRVGFANAWLARFGSGGV